jgi:hypothetical protein
MMNISKPHPHRFSDAADGRVLTFYSSDGNSTFQCCNVCFGHAAEFTVDVLQVLTELILIQELP